MNISQVEISKRFNMKESSILSMFFPCSYFRSVTEGPRGKKKKKKPHIMVPKHGVKLLLPPYLARLGSAQELGLLRLLPAREMRRVLAHLGEVVRVVSERLQRDGQIQRPHPRVAEAEHAHGHLARSLVQEVDGPEGRRGRAEDGGHDGVHENLRIPLRRSERRCGRHRGRDRGRKTR